VESVVVVAEVRMENRVQLASSAVLGCGDIGPKRASPHGVALRGANHLHIRSHP